MHIFSEYLQLEVEKVGEKFLALFPQSWFQNFLRKLDFGLRDFSKIRF